MPMSADAFRIIQSMMGGPSAPTAMPTRPGTAGLGTFLPTGYQGGGNGPAMGARPGPMQGSFSPMGGFTPGGGMGPAMGSRPAPSMGMGGMFGGGAQQISPDQLSAILGRGGRNPDGSPHTGDEAFFGPQVGGGGVAPLGGSSQAPAMNIQSALAGLFGAGAATKPAPVASQGTTLAALLGRSGRAI